MADYYSKIENISVAIEEIFDKIKENDVRKFEFCNCEKVMGGTTNDLPVVTSSYRDYTCFKLKNEEGNYKLEFDNAIFELDKCACFWAKDTNSFSVVRFEKRKKIQ